MERRYQVNVIILCALCIVCNCVGICLLPRRILEVLKAIFPKKERLSHMFILLLPLSTRMMRTLEKILEETYVENSSKMITDHIKTLMYRPPIDNFTSIEIQATEHQVRVISLNCRKKIQIATLFVCVWQIFLAMVQSRFQNSHIILNVPVCNHLQKPFWPKYNWI